MHIYTPTTTCGGGYIGMACTGGLEVFVSPAVSRRLH